jgi:hypothetical protein
MNDPRTTDPSRSRPGPRGRWLAAGAAALALTAGLTAFAADDPKKPQPAPPQPPQQPAPQENLPDAMAIIERSIQAGGGREAMQKITSRSMRGKIEAPSMGLSLNVEILQSADRFRMTVNNPQVGTTQMGHDGTWTWEYSEITGARLLEGSERANIFRSGLLNAELRTSEFYSQMRTVGPATIDGRPTWKLELVTKDGAAETRYYDQESGLLVRIDAKVESPMGVMETQTILASWKELDGIKYPSVSVTRLMGMELRTTADEVKHNVEFPEGTFALPDEVRELVEARKKQGVKDGAGDGGNKPADKPGNPAPKPDKPM